MPVISSRVAGRSKPPASSSAVTASAMAHSSAGVAEAPRVLETDSSLERSNASAADVDVDASAASADDDDDDAVTGRCVTAR